MDSHTRLWHCCERSLASDGLWPVGNARATRGLRLETGRSNSASIDAAMHGQAGAGPLPGSKSLSVIR